mgnify:CR=1 FL=1
MNEQFDAVVIGSGVGGLTAAAYLAAAGRRTLVLEAYDLIGGSTHAFRRAGKWEFDVGVHYLADCGPDGDIPAILRGVGLGEVVRFVELDPTGFDRIVVPGATVAVPRGWDNFRAALCAAFPAERPAIDHVTGILERLGGAANQATSPRSTWTLATSGLRAGLAARWSLRPLTHLLDSVPMSRALRTVLTVHFETYSTPPNRVPAVVHAVALNTLLTTGAWYPAGGGQVLAARLGQAIVANGGEIRTRNRVRRIEVEAGAVRGVRLDDGTCIDAPIVVSNADIKKTFTDLVDARHLRRRTRRRFTKYRMSLPYFNSYLGVNIDLRAASPQCNYFVAPTTDPIEDILAELENATIPVETRVTRAAQRMPIYIHLSSVKDPDNPRTAPPGGTSVEVMGAVPAAPELWGLHSWPIDASYQQNPEYLRLKNVWTDIMVERLLRVFPQAEGHIVWREAATPFTQSRFTTATDGAGYGLRMSLNQFGPLRPGTRTEIDGLYLAGGSYSWGPTVSGAMLSGIHAAGSILGEDLYARAKRGEVMGNRLDDLVEGTEFDALQTAKRLAARRTRRTRRVVRVG